jgi:hypothetical protein
MSRFENIETSALLDMLAEYTRQLTELFMKKNQGKQYQYCKKTIQELQTEIQNRKKSAEGKKSSRNNKSTTEGSN